MAKYPKIVIDRSKNTPVDIVHAEKNYDFMHHTHKMSDIVDDIGSGGGTGKDGKSAYESWLSLGNTGTEQNFIDSLKGKDGNDGVSPIVTLSRTEENDGAVISIKDVNGTNNVIIYDGINSTIDWDKITNKLFEGLDSKYFIIDNNSNLTLSDTAFNDIINERLNIIIEEINKKAVINDTSISTDNTWSSSKIQEELDKKTESDLDHDHENLDNVLDKFSVDGSNNLQFDTRIIMTEDKYDIDSDGKVDHANTADELEGLLASITELNYLLGARSNIQSQIDAILDGVTFKGEYANFAVMESNIPTPEKGDWVFILTDETKDQTNTQYVHDGSKWVYGGDRTTVNEATNNVKGIIQLAGDLTGTATAPLLKEVITAQTVGYIKSITVDKNGRVIGITEDTTLAQRILDLESRPQIYISETQPTNLKDGDFWIEG